MDSEPHDERPSVDSPAPEFRSDTVPPPAERVQTEEAPGRQVLERHHYYHGPRDGGPALGVAVFLAGAVLLGNTFNLVSWEFWSVVAPLWPALLIVGGFQMVVGYGWVGRFLAFFVALAILGSAVLYGVIRTESPLLRYVPPDANRFIRNLPEQGN